MSALMTGFVACVALATSPSPQESVAQLHNKHPVTGIVFAPDNKTLYIASGNVVREWDVRLGQIRRTFNHPDAVAAIVLSPNGSYLAASGAANGRDDHFPSLLIWEVSSGKRIYQIPGLSCEANICSLAFSPNGKWLA